MDRDGVNDWRVDGTMLHLLVAAASPLDGQLFHGIENFPSRQDMPEYCVQIIEMRLSLIANEELGSIGIGSLIGHADRAPPGMSIGRMEFVRKGHGTPNTFSPLGPRFLGRVAHLNHEPLDIPMSNGPIVGVTRRQGQEVKGRPRRRVTIYFQLNVTQARV
jgi:hypothetical protein